MYNDSRARGASDPTLTNVTFYGNAAEGDGGAMFNNGDHAGVSRPRMANVILWGNVAGGRGDQMYNLQATPTVGYSLVEGGWDGSGVYNDKTSVIDGGGNIDGDPLFVDAAGGNLRLGEDSPAIDAGDNGAVPAGVTSDLDGNPRLVDVPTVADTGQGTPPVVDMGAYEVQVDGAPDLAINKSVVPEVSVGLQGRVTYAIVLRNRGTLRDAHVAITDTLPGRVSFGAWIERPPGAVEADDVVTWRGTVAADAAMELSFSADYVVEGYGEVVTNTARLNGTAQTGWVEASFRTVAGVYLPVVLRDE
jgi:uncharacterized repeat protein (TIGR01451 family)